MPTVINRTRAPFEIAHHTYFDAKTPGRTAPKQRGMLLLAPGENSVPEDVWGKVSARKSIAGRIARGDLTVTP